MQPSVEAWIEGGELDARLIRELVERHRPLDEMGAILDFGCGCGRVARHWATLDGPAIFGSDYNKRLARWCRAKLPFMNVTTNKGEPPLSFTNESFELVYAISVFSHLPEGPQRAWMTELRRVLKPGGLLLFTVKGPRFERKLTDAEQELFTRGRFVVHNSELSGNNACSAFHPPNYVRQELLPTVGLEFVESVHEKPPGTPNIASVLLWQDTYLARRQ